VDRSRHPHTILVLRAKAPSWGARKLKARLEMLQPYVQALIEQLEQGHSEALTAMGRFHTYSFRNILEIARQKPDATRIAGLVDVMRGDLFRTHPTVTENGYYGDLQCPEK
jgi:hypothetical protein